MVNNQLQTLNNGYPLKFFPAKDFDKDFVFDYIYSAYEAYQERGREPIVSSGLISKGPVELFQAGVVARICTLNEDFPESLFFPQQLNEMIRDMYENFNGDVWSIVNELERINPAFPIDQRLEELFREDIETVLNLMHVSHLADAGTYSGLKMFKIMRPDGEAFSSDLVIEALFENNPIVKVW